MEKIEGDLAIFPSTLPPHHTSHALIHPSIQSSLPQKHVNIRLGTSLGCGSVFVIKQLVPAGRVSLSNPTLILSLPT